MHEYAEADGYRDSNRKSAALVVWGLAWVVTLALARFGPQLLWDSQPVVSWIAVALNVVVGVGWIVAFTRFLKAVDDLHRKILLDALAITLGVGWVVGFGFVVADAAGLIAGDVDLAAFPILLGVVFVLAFAFGRVRYR